ncbi:hypothetical protein GCM10009555_075220 [Acrocarpospora macrocephala]|uniref:RHIM domain-containing protein n=1 Tax=Acrocarpospora macrocephala TaxID=150177 RepID=A0A5M3X6J3_9ACTN|nr:hypothetical protein [Acrocarpospora macrocephala]GES14483.1 hypothetical protein Amac_080800 [Acrocarpospora macrocephala]
MDPVTLILEALAAGAAAGVTAGVTDAYTGLKNLLVRRFGDDPALEDAGQDPDLLRELLGGLGDDPEVLRAASAVLESADPQGAAAGKYTVTVYGSKGVTIGDHNQITQHFTE